MSQTFAENKINVEENKINCCVCYDDDNSEEGKKGKLIECCPNKHILCIECFHKSYERKCECPLCRELMYKHEKLLKIIEQQQLTERFISELLKNLIKENGFDKELLEILNIKQCED